MKQIERIILRATTRIRNILGHFGLKKQIYLHIPNIFCNFVPDLVCANNNNKKYMLMKKILTLCIAVLMAATSVQAKQEIGGILGGMNGVSYKFWIMDNLAVQADMAVGLSRIYGNSFYKGKKLAKEGVDFGMYDFTLNPNALYHFDLPENFKIYAGAGFNIGLMSHIDNVRPQGIMGKFGLNIVGGACYEFEDIPLVMALDMRPGYGLGFTEADEPHFSFFDWKVGFMIRYVL